MKRLFISTSLIVALFFCAANPMQAQVEDDKYKVVQGLGYLHTQVSLLLTNWEIHPLNDIPLEDVAEQYYEHFLEEFEHDEEWVEFMLVEENLLDGFGEGLDGSVEEAIDENLIFYDQVYKVVKQPGKLSKELDNYKRGLKTADERLYGVIYPALVK